MSNARTKKNSQKTTNIKALQYDADNIDSPIGMQNSVKSLLFRYNVIYNMSNAMTKNYSLENYNCFGI